MQKTCSCVDLKLIQRGFGFDGICSLSADCFEFCRLECECSSEAFLL